MIKILNIHLVPIADPRLSRLLIERQVVGRKVYECSIPFQMQTRIYVYVETLPFMIIKTSNSPTLLKQDELTAWSQTC